MAYNRPARREGSRNQFEGRNFNRERSGGFGKGRRSRDQSFGRPEMHEVVCAKCGKQCEVPFKPTSDKPVYCSDCFRQTESSGRRFSPRGLDRNRQPQMQTAISSEQHTEINAKLDKILNILQKLEDKPDHKPEEVPKKKPKKKAKKK